MSFPYILYWDGGWGANTIYIKDCIRAILGTTDLNVILYNTVKHESIPIRYEKSHFIVGDA